MATQIVTLEVRYVESLENVANGEYLPREAPQFWSWESMCDDWTTEDDEYNEYSPYYTVTVTVLQAGPVIHTDEEKELIESENDRVDADDVQ